MVQKGKLLTLREKEKQIFILGIQKHLTCLNITCRNVFYTASHMLNHISFK